MKAMIFAAGFGTRLRPITDQIPKALVEINQIPILKILIEQLIDFGVEDIIINTHYLHLKIQDYLTQTKFPLSIRLSYEPKILGTGGGLFNTMDFWDTEDFYLCNCDIITTFNRSKFITDHLKNGAMATLAINNAKSDSMLLVDDENNLVGIQKKKSQSILKKAVGKLRPVGFCGIHMISPKIFNYLNENVAFSIIDEYLKLLKEGISIKTWDIGNDFWVDVGSKVGLETANRQFQTT